MDQPHYDWSPITGRVPLKWPAGKPVALAVVILVEHVELYPPEGSVQIPVPAGNSFVQFPFPNMPTLAQREYGHRVGIFRILDILGRLNIPASVAIDAMAAERYPFIVDYCRDRNAEFIAHGISVSRTISSQMSETAERVYIADALTRIRASTGASIRGWLGPHQSESESTPLLLDEAGIDYVMDWPNDEQPYYMNTPRGLISLPTAYELDDAVQMVQRRFSAATYGRAIIDAFEYMAADGETSARSMILVARPSVVGHHLRIAALESALTTIAASGRAWAATAGEIVESFRRIA
jgi:peptidoglycan/xylan/chitin deacetylase (PgdA/CDA1 family)